MVTTFYANSVNWLNCIYKNVKLTGSKSTLHFQVKLYYIKCGEKIENKNFEFFYFNYKIKNKKFFKMLIL